MKYSLSMFFLILLAACNNNKPEKKYLEYEESLLGDTDSLYIIRCLTYGLENLRDSPQNDQVRLSIATPAGEADTTQILILKETIYGWEASFNKYLLGTLSNYKPTIIYKSFTIKEPGSGWDSILKEMKHTGIYTLSDKNRKQSDAVSCTEALRIEIVKDGKYSSYDFYNWIAIEDKTQIRKIEKFIELCRQAFGFDLLKLNLDKIKTTEDCRIDTLGNS
jgi:hypothetical protein